jgi:hypothetical protein
MSSPVMSDTASLWRIFGNGRFLEMICLVAIFAVIYPFIGFATVKIYLNKPLDDDKNKIIELFGYRKYMLVCDENKVMIFRPQNKFHRLTRMYEDFIELDYSDTILKFSGLRKDVYRYKLMLEEFARQEKIQNS